MVFTNVLFVNTKDRALIAITMFLCFKAIDGSGPGVQDWSLMLILGQEDPQSKFNKRENAKLVLKLNVQTSTDSLYNQNLSNSKCLK